MKPPRFLPATVIFLFVVIVLLPIFYVMITPFWSRDAGRAVGTLFETRHLALARNSLGLAAGTTGFCLAAGVPLAFLLCRTNLWGKRLFGVIYLIPVLIPPYIHAIVWGHQSSVVKEFFSLDIYSIWGVILVLTLAYFPFVTLTTSSGLRSIDKNLEEASLLSHGRWKTLSRVTLPLVAPHILSGAVFVFIFSVTDFAVPDILRVRVYPIEVFIQFSAFYDERAAVVLSLPLIAIAFVLIGLMKWSMKDRPYIQIEGGISKTTAYSLGGFNIPAFGFCLILLGLSVGLPMAVLLKVAGPLSTYVGVLRTSMDQIAYSLVLAFSGTLCALVLAFSLAYLLERSRTRLAGALGLASVFPLAIPSITLGIGLITVWNQPLADFVYESSFIIIIGYIARFIPFSVMTVTSGVKQLNPRLEEAAFLTTSRWRRVIAKIVVPLLRRSLLAGLFIVFILAFGELGTTLLVIPPGRETIPIKIYNFMHYGAEPMVAALCVTLIVVILAFSGFFLAIHNRLVERVGG